MNANSDATLRIHLVGKDAGLREEMVQGLIGLGFKATGFGNAADFHRALADYPCDIAVIDVGRSGEEGLSLAGQLRDTSRIGIVLLSARGQREDRLRGLADADLYMTKPVDLVELGASLCSLARRLLQSAGQERPTGGDWRLMDEEWTLYSPGGDALHLTASELRFMKTLFADRGRAVARETLALALGGDTADYDPHRLETLVSRLRKKAAEGGLVLPLRAVRGIGYVINQRAPRE